MDTDSSIVYTKTDKIYKDIAQDKKKVTGLMKDESGRKTITTFVGLRSKTYSYLIDDGNEDKKAIATKKCVIKKT